jgi:hypothetical protein
VIKEHKKSCPMKEGSSFCFKTNYINYLTRGKRILINNFWFDVVPAGTIRLIRVQRYDLVYKIAIPFMPSGRKTK